MRRVILALLLALLPAIALAQDHFALEIIRPRPVGAKPDLDAENRIFRAYQGMPYEFYATARGGQWPYTYSLTGAPTGMTVEAGPCTTATPSCTAGKISWPDPQTSDASITLQVCDVDLDCTSQTWGVTVSTTACSSASGWCFVDADVADGGDGSIGNPYNTISDVWNGSTAASRVMVLRGSTTAYLVTGMTQTQPGDCDEQVAWNEATRPVIWLGYPGEDVTINFDYDSGVSTSGPCQELAGENVWLQGFDAIDLRSIGFQVGRGGNHGIYVADVTFTDLTDGADGANSGFIMWTANYGNPSYGDTITHVSMTGVGTNACALKVYSSEGGVFEHLTVGTSLDDEGMIALKAEVATFTVRASRFSGHPTGVGGNMNGAPTGGATLSTNGEIYHNAFLDSSELPAGNPDGAITLGWAKVNTIGRVYVYRNTIKGKINIASLVTADGTYDFTSNVIENDQAASGSCPAKYTCTSVTDYARLVATTNLDVATTDGATDASGLLTGTYRTDYLGLRGFELQGGGSSSNGGGVRLRLRGDE